MQSTFWARLNRHVRRGFLALALGAAALPGCKLLDSSTPECKNCQKGPPMGLAVNCFTFWNHEIAMVQDPVRGGQEGPCVVGSMYLMGEDGKPVCAVGMALN